MRTARRLGVYSCVALALSSCASPGLHMAEIQVPPERIVQKGYSLVPLNEKGWVVARRDPGRLSLAKRGEMADTTIAIQGTLFRLPRSNSSGEFVQLLKDGQAKDTDPQRFRVLKHEVLALSRKGTQCARSHMVAEDHSGVRGSSPMIFELLTLTCAHPRDPSIGIDIGYSERYHAGQRDPAFVDRAETVFSSVEFTGF